MSRSVFLLLFLNIFLTIQAGKILFVIPTPSYSHQVIFFPLTEELAKRGHEVVVITTDPSFPKGQAPPNLTEIDFHDLSYGLWRNNCMSTNSGQKVTTHTQMSIMLDVMNKVVIQQLLSDEVQDLIKNKSDYFDLVLVEAWVMNPTLLISHFIKAPVILISSLGAVSGNNELIGAPIYPPLLYPTFMRKRLYNLSLREKLEELYNFYQIERMFANHEAKGNAMIKEVFGADTPDLHEFQKNVHMIFYNIHPIWEDNRPVPPSVIYMGGLQVNDKPPKKLPEDLKSYLDSSVHGVIYVSFGTNVSPSMFPPEKVKLMVKVFSELPYDILWKWDKNELPGKSKNIKIAKWFPQADLLKHPKVKLFITQGGLQSTDEALQAGVPLIGMPMLGDQWFNTDKYPRHKIGIKYEMKNLAEDTFKKTINTIIEDESYRRNVAKFRETVFDQPLRPLERTVWWIEHVLRHGGARHLQSPAFNMTWSEYLDLELLSVILIGLLLIFAVTTFVIYSLWNYVTSRYFYAVKIKKS